MDLTITETNKDGITFFMDTENKIITTNGKDSNLKLIPISPIEAYMKIQYEEYRLPKKEKHMYEVTKDYNNYPDVYRMQWTTVIREELLEKSDNPIEMMDEILRINGNRTGDYILVQREGYKELAHNSQNLKPYIGKKYQPSLERIEEGGGSFAIGLYFLDYDLTLPLIEDDNWYKAEHEGLYFECIGDLCNGEKCGYQNPQHKEFFIPIDTENIIWKEINPDTKESTSIEIKHNNLIWE